MNIAKTSTLLTSAAFAVTLGISAAQADADLEFIQWWEPELPAGALRGIMDEFEAGKPRYHRYVGERALLPARATRLWLAPRRARLATSSGWTEPG